MSDSALFRAARGLPTASFSGVAYANATELGGSDEPKSASNMLDFCLTECEIMLGASANSPGRGIGMGIFMTEFTVGGSVAKGKTG